jgi:dihydroorotate dehydrogenase electron transfer subunit
MTAHQVKSEVVRKEQLAKDVIRLTLAAPEIAAQASPGQFMMLKAADKLEPLLRRPFSIHQATANGQVQILFKVVGKGSKYLAEREKGDMLDIVGPLGHGFVLPRGPSENICIVGGGMGCAPLYFLTKRLLKNRLGGRLQVYLGATTAKELAVVKEDFENLGVKVFAATDDGSLGYHGFVTDLVADSLEQEGQRWQFYSCGPHPMMNKVALYCAAQQWPCQVSLETMMACGISACLGCTVRSSPAKLISSNKQFLHVCKDGPVFDSGDIAWTTAER